jgi:hypothetical protein
VLLVKQFDRIETMNIDYHGGLQYPVLERIAGKPDRLRSCGRRDDRAPAMA